jgi:hypothetical protein
MGFVWTPPPSHSPLKTKMDYLSQDIVWTVTNKIKISVELPVWLLKTGFLTTSLRTSRFASHPGPILLVIHVLHIYTCIYLTNTQELNTNVCVLCVNYQILATFPPQKKKEKKKDHNFIFKKQDFTWWDKS